MFKFFALCFLAVVAVVSAAAKPGLVAPFAYSSQYVAAAAPYTAAYASPYSAAYASPYSAAYASPYYASYASPYVAAAPYAAAYSAYPYSASYLLRK